MTKLLSIFLVLILLLFTYPTAALANTYCSNRFVTLVNPVRGRDLWVDKSLKPFDDQLATIRSHQFSATWLLQYDALVDQDLISDFQKTDHSQEKGLLLEVSQGLANQARVIYPYNKPWFDPSAVFLSGYSQSERRGLIDTDFNKFKQVFGYYPKSVGAWWIDSYSLNYMREKYGIKTAMIVADQKTTDSYGVWGQWWGVPYIPSKANILTPASSLENRQDVVVIQWAQRDPDKAVGQGWLSSNYSLQANDYTRLGLTTAYFGNLVNTYLDCKNSLGQITVGLETGIEGVNSQGEYNNQLNLLATYKNLQSVTMSQFADNFSRVYPDFPNSFEIKGNSVDWQMSTQKRSGYDFVNYNQGTSFGDYFLADKSSFLERDLTKQNKSVNEYPLFVFPIFLLLLLIFSFWKKLVGQFITSLLFSFSAFGLLIKSGYLYGWDVFYGPVVGNVLFTKIAVLLGSFILMTLLSKRFKTQDLFLIVIIWGLNFILEIARFSKISGLYLVGIALDNLRFLGLSIGRSGLSFINRDLPAYQSAALLRFNFSKIWDHNLIYFLLYPAVYLLLGILIAKFTNQRIKFWLIFVLTVLWLFYIKDILLADPYRVL